MQWISENANLLIFITFLLVFIFKGKVLGMIYKVPSISPGELKEIISTKKVTLIDVRTKAEFNQGHIPMAQNIPLNEMTKDRLNHLNLKEKGPVYLICASGNRSLWAGITLRKW